MEFAPLLGLSEETVCERCRGLDIIRLLHSKLPWKSLQELDAASRDGSELFHSIGQVGSIEFRSDCAVCRCLFALTPHPSSLAQEVIILPHWTMGRLVGENENGMILDEKVRYANCLLVVLNPSSQSLPFSHAAHRGDGLCIMESDEMDSSLTMGGREIEPEALNTDLIAEWLDRCERLHASDCKPQYTAQLQEIRLIDVESRVVVIYPKLHCEYLALSYVWGGVEQQSFKIGASLPEGRLPQTIEDAMLCARMLGKRYLWVDAVCIDQMDEADKRKQIDLMWSIYRGAWLTVIALSSKSADEGLARLGSRPAFSQLRCKINGKNLVGLMPTLTQQIWVSPWGRRAWTLQEALLSPRSLYLSNHQLYFECNAMQCCESLDQSSSWAHNLDCNTKSQEQSWITFIKTQNGPGCLTNSLDSPGHRLIHWGAKLTLYSYRSMTKDEDALNAFTGVLQQLETMYDSGFFGGLPQADFHWGLLWQAQSQPQRRPGFPSWSWAGWSCPIWPAHPRDVSKTYQFPVWLHVQRVHASVLVDVFNTQKIHLPGRFEAEPFSNDNALERAAVSVPTDAHFDIRLYPQAQDDGYLFMEAIALDFQPDYSNPIHRKKGQGKFEIFMFLMRGVRCGLQIMSTDSEIDGTTKKSGQPIYLLLARDHGGGLVHHYLLLVYIENGLAVRGTVMMLLIPEDHLGILDNLKPRKRRVILT